VIYLQRHYNWEGNNRVCADKSAPTEFVAGQFCSPPKAERQVGLLIVAVVPRARITLGYRTALQPMLASAAFARMLVESRTHPSQGSGWGTESELLLECGG
jgi:hypothetical protein